MEQRKIILAAPDLDRSGLCSSHSGLVGHLSSTDIPALEIANIFVL
jgi:hypothetical protein